MKQFIFTNTDGYYEEGSVDGHGETRACDASLAVGDLVCESSTITNGVDKVTSNSETRDVIGYVIGKPDATTANILMKGVISGLSGLTKAGKVFLSSNGGFTSTIPSNGYIKTLGQAIDADTIDFDPSITKVKMVYKAIAPAQYTKILIHSDTYDGDTTFVDSSPNNFPITANIIKHSTDQAKFGNTSFRFIEDTQTRLVIDNSALSVGTNDFTVDFWYYSLGNQSIGMFFSYGGNNEPFSFKGDDSTPFKPYVYGNSLTSTFFSETVPTGVWTHLALERYNGVLYGYINGVNKFTVSYTDDVSTGETDVTIGAMAGTAIHTIDGYMDEYRFLNGYADYKGVDFTPPTQPYAVV
jgi:hypothetical protein